MCIRDRVYSQIFLTFVKGLVGVDQSADVYLFHTRLMRVTEYLKENDTLKAVNRISLLTEGFSGGTKIGKSLKEFNNVYSKNQESSNDAEKYEECLSCQ